jgi:hypothetical protein
VTQLWCRQFLLQSSGVTAELLLTCHDWPLFFVPQYHAKPAGRPDPDAEMMNATRLKDQLDRELHMELFRL